MAHPNAIATLPKLLSDAADRERFVELLTKLRSDPRLLGREASEYDLGVIKAVKEVLGVNRPRLAAAKEARGT